MAQPAELFRCAAAFIDKIIPNKTCDLPIEQPTQFGLGSP
jgi:hypothetical protein